VITLSLNNLGEFELARAALCEAGIQKLDCIEILWDNYCHLDAGKLAEYLAPFSTRISLHVMWSRFLERDEDELTVYLARLREHCHVLDPIAVSDHLCTFRSQTLRLAIPQEHDYVDLAHVVSRVERYQDAIGRQLLVENNASTDYPVERQLALFDPLVARTGCGVLFDVSNAVAGELNGLGDVSVWLDWLAGRDVRAHVGSYAHNENTGLTHDTHDQDVSATTAERLGELVRVARVASITLERDYNKTVAALARDLRLLRAAVEPDTAVAA
jgi:uncharacterized protein